MPTKLLILEHPVNPNSSVTQSVLLPYQRGSKSSLSLDGQRGEHGVSQPSEKNSGFTFCYPPAWSVMLQKRKVSGAEDCSKRPMSKFEKNLGFCSCSFCVSSLPPSSVPAPLLFFLDFPAQEVSQQLSQCRGGVLCAQFLPQYILDLE